MRIHTGFGIAAVVLLAGSAQADMVGTFGFTDMSGSYDGQSFSAAATGNLPTGGDVTDYTGASLISALFESGLIGQHDQSAVVFSMDINNVGATTADGDNGQFTITDLDGDILEGTFEGIWDYRFGFGFFDGEITLASYDDQGDGFFEGTGIGNEFETPDGDYVGALSFLIEMPQWFLNAAGAPVTFNERSTQGDGILLTPAPAGVAMFGLGGLVAARRRRA